MGTTAKLTQRRGRPTVERLHINLRKGKISADLHAIKYVDNDTKQFIAAIPSLEVSGYGETDKKAMEMLQFSLDSFGNFITSLTPDNIKKELAKLGWHKTMFHKDFSKAYVDIEGQLQNFNAENNKIEQLTLQAV
jgi:hypothetical protein